MSADITAATVTLPRLAGGDQKDHDALIGRLARLRAIRQQYAAAIIAGGIFSDFELWTGVLAALAEEDAQKSSDALQAFLNRLEAEQPDSTQIPFPSQDNPDQHWSAWDVIVAHASEWGDAGFLLGLAVGMQLGPHAFESLEAKGRR